MKACCGSASCLPSGLGLTCTVPPPEGTAMGAMGPMWLPAAAGWLGMGWAPPMGAPGCMTIAGGCICP